jgi:ElaB/YqjD/DUF883 family membrane-anchored ribosome-binding protein
LEVEQMAGRVLDEQFEAGVKANAAAAAASARKEVEMAELMLLEKEKKLEAVVKEHPMMFVLGAFVGGVILGALISKRG